MSFPRYPKYKGSGFPWLSHFPEHWFVGQVKHVCSFFTGWTPPTGDAASYVGDNYWANISDLGPKWLNDTNKQISDEAVVKSDIRVSRAGDLLFSFKLSIGQVSFAGVDLYTNEAIATFPPSARLNLRYGYYALPFFLVRNASENIYGAKLLNQELMRSARVVLPPLSEQEQLADFLECETAKIDILVAEQEQLITLLKEKRQAVISHAVTKGLDPSVPMKDSGVEWLGDVPEHWSVGRIKHVVASFGQGWSPQCENFPAESEADWGVLKVGCVNGGVFKPEENKALPRDLAALPELGACSGDLLISRANTRELVGSAAVVLRDHKNLLLCDKLYRLRLTPSLCLPGFLALFLSTEIARGQIELEATGASSSMVNIAQSTILEMDVPLPSVTEQASLLSTVEQRTYDHDQLIAEAVRSIELLCERRSALISAAVTGQIDVRGLVPAHAP